MPEFNDPAFPSQFQIKPGNGINATPVYDEYTGRGVRIGVVDTGFDYGNPDFLGQADLLNDVDALDGDDNANNAGGDQHGTEVGLILGAAANNGFGRVGAAHGATMVAYRFDTRSLRTVEQETALLELQDQVDISHNSWSRSGEFFRDDFGLPEYAAAAAAIADAAANGRGGLGTVTVRSAGNDAQRGDDANTHNYYNNRFTVVVGATDAEGEVQPFSNPSAALTVVAPGTATSWTAPLGSATAALMLEANPELGYRDVVTILSLSARRTDADEAGWQFNAAEGWNGGGLHTARRAGFGLIDALAAVRLAETWDARSTEANRAEASAGGAGDAAIPDAGALEQGVGIGEDIRVERAELRLQLSHEKIGDLRVTLVSPGGTESVLLDRLALGEYAERDTLGFTFTSTQFLWEGSRGDWTLRVEDAASGAAGVLEGWTLTVHGAPASPDSAHVFTDEYAASVAADPARGTLRDAGGTDTLNAAAVTSASSIDLRPGAASEIAGAGLAILGGSWIENAEGGDGGDLLRGNELDNRLRGWRGDDSLEGGAGDDRLFGGGGDDIAVYDGPAARFVLEALPDGQLRVRDTAGALGTDILSGVERLGFTDGPVAAVAPETVIA